MGDAAAFIEHRDHRGVVDPHRAVVDVVATSTRQNCHRFAPTAMFRGQPDAARGTIAGQMETPAIARSSVVLNGKMTPPGSNQSSLAKRISPLLQAVG